VGPVEPPAAREAPQSDAPAVDRDKKRLAGEGASAEPAATPEGGAGWGTAAPWQPRGLSALLLKACSHAQAGSPKALRGPANTLTCAVIHVSAAASALRASALRALCA
jgi:hypothetical protein